MITKDTVSCENVGDLEMSRECTERTQRMDDIRKNSLSSVCNHTPQDNPFAVSFGLVLVSGSEQNDKDNKREFVCECE